VTTSGSSVIFADIFASIQRDGPKVTLVAMAGLLVMVLIVVGRDRRAVAVLSATVLGSLGLVAVCALAGIRVNFLDFIALPITLGLGVDYAINIAHPAYLEAKGPYESVRQSGSSVFICSLTTIVGYGSLMVSDNRAIYGFGLSKIGGLAAQALSALALVPAIGTAAALIAVPTILAMLLILRFGRETRGRDLRELELKASNAGSDRSLHQPHSN